MAVHRATTQEKIAITELALRFWPEYEFTHLLLKINDILSDPTKALVVGYENHLLVAFALACLESKEGLEPTLTARLKGIYVEPDYRRKGLASQLLALLETWAEDKGSQRFVVEVPAQNLACQGFYETHGYKTLAPTVRFEKKLSPPTEPGQTSQEE